MEVGMSGSQALHVVVLDGSPLYAEIYGNLFASEGYRVSALTDCAVDPATVLALAPDLIVLDLRCGAGLRGLDFLRRLRTDPDGRDVPVVASTPASLLDMERYEDELRALGAAIFDGFSQFDDLLVAAREATALARETRQQSRAARDRHCAAREQDSTT
jgi:CheY-like chemotaxis protein